MGKGPHLARLRRLSKVPARFYAESEKWPEGLRVYGWRGYGVVNNFIPQGACVGVTFADGTHSICAKRLLAQDTNPLLG
jgi:hypothetical protein